MTIKEKKEYAILAVLLLAIVGVVYFNFFKKPSIPELPATITPAAVVPSPDGSGAVPVVPTGVPSGAGASGKFLPNGTKLDLDGLANDRRFNRLQAPDYPSVDKSELGLQDPFN